jgi:uncharacterized membrane protein YkgB
VPLVSSPESVRQGRLSALAVVETVVASGISLWLAWKHNTLEHIVIASALAPFLLLRPRRSTQYTVLIFEKIEDQARLWSTLFVPLIKIFCSTKTFLQHPLDSVLSIPGNFYKYVFVVDSFSSPQAIPGADEVDNKSSMLKEFNDIYRIPKFIFDNRKFARQTYGDSYPFSLTMGIIFDIISVGILSTMIMPLMPMMLLAFSFRIAIKSTSIIWLPLLWVIHQSRPGTKVLDRIYLNVRQPWSKLMLIYSLFVIAGFAAKVLLIVGIWKSVQLNWPGPVGELGTRLVDPLYLPLWQITSALNAIMAWGFFFRAERHLLARNSTEAWPEAWVRREYVGFQAVRTTLSLYAIACTFYLAAATAWQTEWPPIHVILFPWSPPPGP